MSTVVRLRRGRWHPWHVPDSKIPASPSAVDDGAEALSTRLEALVPAWLSVPDAAALQGTSLSRVRSQIAEGELVAVRRGPNRAVYIPAAFVTPEGPLPELKGTATVLADGGMSDAELIEWLFTPDDTLPVPGTPMDCFAAGHKTEVRRRAMELAF